MKDPRDSLNQEKMSLLQIAVVIITILLNAIDGFDVLSISFAAPGMCISLMVIGYPLGGTFGGMLTTRMALKKLTILILVLTSVFVTGVLFQAGATLPSVALVMGLGSLLAGLTLLFAQTLSVKEDCAGATT